MSRDFDILKKLVLIGDSAVGKSSILLRFADDEFQDAYVCTIGVDFRFRTVQVGDLRIKLQVWDTAGQERFRTITSSYYRGAHGILLVFSVDDRDSFEHVQNWVAEISKFTTTKNLMLVANKCDKEKLVSDEEAQALADELGVELCRCSAKSGDGVDSIFLDMARLLLRDRKGEDAVDPDTIQVKSKRSKGKGCCKS